MNVPDRTQSKPEGRARRLIERARQRRGERGAAVFLVVLVLTIVAAIGVFSMRSAGLVDLATGYSRQSVQATFMANYAARAAATYLESNPDLATSTDYVTGCASALRAIDPTAPCLVFKTNVLGDALLAAPDGMAGQLSLLSDPTQIQAEFVTEMTEPSIANIRLSPGFTSGLFKQVTFTSIARVYPTAGTITGVCSTAAAGTVSQQTLRAHVIVP
jgi:Tfp pilus assembly protein PilX